MKKRIFTQLSFKAGGMISLLALLFQLIQPLNTRAAVPDGTVIRGERPPINISTVPDEAIEQGIIRVKFSKSLEAVIDNMLLSKNPDGTVKFGIKAIDELNQQFGVYEVRRTFEPALQNTKFTDRHRAWGFHLWYDLLIPAGTDIRGMVQSYSAKNEVQLSEPVYRKQLIGAEASPVVLPKTDPGNNSGVYYTPNDPRYNEQWHYHNTGQQSGTVDADIDLPEAWDITKGSSEVVVAIIDQGVDYTHPDLAANMWSGIGYNFVNGNSTIIPGDHGTHVGGTIAANTNNAVGVSGIAGGTGIGDGVRLMSCQVFIGNSGGSGFGAAAIWAADNGAAISQNSWGYTSPGYFEQATLDGIDYFNVNGGGTVMNGGITIYAAGNSGTSGLYYPGCYSGVFSVSATNNQDLKSWYSNYDTWIDIAAPGGETNTLSARGVLSTLSGNNYGFYQGTSMACPHVSGVAALILSLGSGVFTPQNIKDILTSTSDDIDALNPTYAGLLGSGRLNAYQALLLAETYLVPTAAFSASPTTLCTNGSVTFTNQSYGDPTSWNWSFPGGTPSSYSGQNPPAITYSVNGTYNVSLTVSDGITTDTETKTNYISVQGVVANFSASATTIVEGGNVTFTDLSGCSPTSWSWSFPGGSPSSYSGQTPPAVTYASAGTYNVSLTVSKPGSNDTETKVSYITVNPPVYNMTNGSVTTCAGSFYDSGGPTGAYVNYEDFTFTFYPATPGASIEVQFSSFNVESGYDYLYIYNGDNTSAPLIGTYTGSNSPGTILANNGSGALTFRFTSDYIVIAAGWAASVSCQFAELPPLAEFSASEYNTTVYQTIIFTDLSTNSPDSWSWSFTPDNVVFVNGTSASSQNPEVQFTAPGSYSVTLTATNAFGSDDEVRNNYIQVAQFDYCIPSYNNGNGSGDYISLVQLGSISNSTGPEPDNFYTYYSSLSTDLLPNETYTITLSAGTYGSGNNISVWIDFNQNGVFDIDEKLGNVTLGAMPATGTITFTVPSGALNGPTRMRVREVWSATDFDPCSTYSFGETEDYNVFINALSYCTPDYSTGTGDGDYISLVQLGSINNATGAFTEYPYYEYFSTQTAFVNAGNEYTITVSAGTYLSDNNISVWIDYDQSGSFDADEKLGNVTLGASPETGSITFVVPADAFPGTTRMRVREVYGDSDIDPCDTYSFGETEDYNVHISASGKTLYLSAFLEGLYAGSYSMNPASSDTGPQFGPLVADEITVELHNESDYSFTEFSTTALLGVNGTVSVYVPAGFNGNYYVTIRHRNSLETTSSSPVDFSLNSVSADFTDPGNVYAGNLLLMIDGAYVIYGGDVNQDGAIDTADMTPVDNDSGNYLTGYIVTDAKGDGVIDTADMTIVDNNSANYIQSAHP